MEKSVTLKDIAREMNVSIVTVSNALAGRSGVGPALRVEIEKKAQEMGYQRKIRREKKSSSQSRVYRTGTKIGVITSEIYLSKYTSFYWEMYQRVAMEASRKGCVVSLEVLSPEREKQLEMPLLFRDREYCGLIVLGMLGTSYLKMLCQRADIPILFLDFDNVDMPCDAVISNGYYGMYQVTNYLLGMGHTDIGFIGNYMATGSIMDRYQGFSKSLLEHGIPERREWILSDRDTDTGKTNLSFPEQLPTAFVCNCDYTAEVAAGILTALGYRIPEDISLVGYDDFLSSGMLKGKLTTYAVDMDEMAHQGLKLLLRRIGGGEQEKTLRTVDGRMVVRESVRGISL